VEVVKEGAVIYYELVRRAEISSQTEINLIMKDPLRGG
jgi:hypothetical protein